MCFSNAHFTSMTDASGRAVDANAMYPGGVQQWWNQTVLPGLASGGASSQPAAPAAAGASVRPVSEVAPIPVKPPAAPEAPNYQPPPPQVERPPQPGVVRDWDWSPLVPRRDGSSAAPSDALKGSASAGPHLGAFG